MSDAATRSRAPRRWSLAHEEILVAALLLVGFLFFWLRLDDFVIGREGTFIGPKFWPGVLLGMGAVLSAIYLVHSIIAARRHDPVSDGADRAERTERTEAQPDTTPEASALHVDGIVAAPAPGEDAPAGDAAAEDQPTRSYIAKTVAAAAILAGYIYLLSWIGFIPATALFTVAFLLLAGERRWWLLTLYPIVASAVVLLVFTQLLSVALPRGTGIFLTFSTYLY